MMYSVSIQPHKVDVRFNGFTEALDVLNIIRHYKRETRCVITHMVLKKEVKNVVWHNDITHYATKPLCLLLLRLKGERVKSAVESTHILEQDSRNSEIVLTITTLNRDNTPPKLLSREDFIRELFEEWLAICTSTPL